MHFQKTRLAEEEAKQAEKVLNSIRGKRSKRSSSSEKKKSSEETVPVTVPSNPDGSNVAPSITSIAPTVSKPRVEKIEVR